MSNASHGWQSQFDRELKQAEDARRNGFEGRARVCARRAAGIVLREFAIQNGYPEKGLNALDLIRIYSEDSRVPPQAGVNLKILVQRVLPGGLLPVEADFLEIVRSLPGQLLDDRRGQ